MKRVLVGGPLLGERNHHATTISNCKRSSSLSSRSVATPASNTTFVPLISSPVSSSSNERLILLPNRQFVTVLAFQTGRRIATLVVPSTAAATNADDDTTTKTKTSRSSSVEITSATLAETTMEKSLSGIQDVVLTTGAADDDASSKQQQQVLLIGCSDGTLHEFVLAQVLQTAATSTLRGQSLAPHDTTAELVLPGPCIQPHGSWKLANNGPVLHLGAAAAGSGVVGVYALVVSNNGISNNKTTTKNKDAASKSTMDLLRITLPARSNSGNSSHRKRSPRKAAPQSTTPTTLQMENSVVVAKDITGSVKRRGSKMPFTLLVTCRPHSPTQTAVFCLLGFGTTVLVYHEVLVAPDNDDSTTISYPVVELTDVVSHHKKKKDQNPLTALALAPNGKDVATGYASGSIRIWSDLLSRLATYCQAKAVYDAQQEQDDDVASHNNAASKPPSLPTKGALVRRLHWHAHAVSTLVFGGINNNAAAPDNRNAPLLLYSGGDESVICTWQLARGTTKPAHVLPRIALGGIVHLQCSRQQQGAESILVYCSDNSLHLFEAHNQCLRWKVRGLAAGGNDSTTESPLSTRPRMVVDPFDRNRITSSSSQPNLLLAGLVQAPGFIQTYDPHTQQVTNALEVAPFNRISRTEVGDSPLPVPMVTHTSWSQDGSTLLTMDTVPTENGSIGASTRLGDGSVVGSVTTIRFWSSSNEEGTQNHPSYKLVAAMAFPHGTTHRVSAVALSPNGKFACTVSNDEGAFRLWRRVTVSGGDKDESKNNKDSATRTAEWVCRYKVDVPSGYANHRTGESAVAFSGDSSVLAIAFGNMVTLWDHEQVNLLTSLWHLDSNGDDDDDDDDASTIDSVQFLNSNKLVDALLVSSAKGVTLQSPYNRQGPSSLGWVWEIPSDEKGVRISFTEFDPHANVVCISLFDETNDHSRLFLVDAASGGISDAQTKNGDKDILPGEVVAIAGASPETQTSGWDDENKRNLAPHAFYALTKSGTLISMIQRQNTEQETSAATRPAVDTGVSAVPKLPTILDTRKRNVSSVLTIADLETGARKKKLSLDRFGAFVGDETAVSSLPQLSGAFVRSFVGRHLQSHE